MQIYFSSIPIRRNKLPNTHYKDTQVAHKDIMQRYSNRQSIYSRISQIEVSIRQNLSNSEEQGSCRKRDAISRDNNTAYHLRIAYLAEQISDCVHRPSSTIQRASFRLLSKDCHAGRSISPVVLHRGDPTGSTLHLQLHARCRGKLALNRRGKLTAFQRPSVSLSART